MPKTIAITPSWYWPAAIPRVVGIPPFGLHEYLVTRNARHAPDAVALVDGAERLTAAELAARVADAAGRPDVSGAAASGPPSVAAVVALLGVLASGAAVDFTGAAPSPGANGNGADWRAPAVGLAAADGAVWHSHRSLLATGLSLGAFWDVGPAQGWCSTFSLSTWEGLAGLTTALGAGAPLVLSEPGPVMLDAAVREGARYAITDLESAVAITRDAKREAKSARGALDAIVCSTRGIFDADERRRIGRLLECAALTLFGMAETGPIFAAHPSWYLDEAIGIPVTNAHVVPVEPRSLHPLPTLWELVESARVTVGSPMQAVGGLPEERRHDRRVVTDVIASSDANGMIYVLPE